MGLELEGKVAFITGAARGIGKGLAEGLLKKGVKVFLSDLNKELGEATLKEFRDEYGSDRVSFSVLDVAGSDEKFQEVFDKAVQTFGQIDVMINNAGIVNEMNFEKTIRVNIGGVMRGTRIAENHMRKDKGGAGGRIINLSSIQGFLTPFVIPTYSATKHAVRAFTSCMSLRPDIRKQGVQYAALCPDAVEGDTSASQALDANTVFPEYFEMSCLIQKTIEKIPLERVVEAALELLSLDNMSGALLAIEVKGKEYRKVTWEATDTFTPEEPPSLGGVQ